MGNKNYTKYSENSKNNNKPVNNGEIVEKEATNYAEELGNLIKEGLEAGMNNDITVTVNDIEPANDENENNSNDENNEEENKDDENNEEENKDSDSDKIGVNAIVAGCNKLYVREEPSKESKPLCIIENGTELIVSLTESTDAFYKVHTVSGETLIAGYCVKEFISIK